MNVILQEDVPNLGRAGDVVAVRDGYGRNFLLPRKKAVMADPKNMTQLEHHKRVVAAKQQKVKHKAEGIADKLKELSITISREAGEEDKLFGSVTTKDIADALRNEGYIIDRHDIHLEAPLKNIGIYDVSVRLHAEVNGIVKIWVVKK
ncbi:MAG: 50S ribosomal protein L9 [Deltaproteobacteria bacterium]|jgi:large subunit ribosomal protein L9|nr:50S ribosomal protein L9 [Deltaproteobacteria bacterium]